MRVLCTPVTCQEQDIREELKREGKFNFNRLLVRDKEISRMELRYVEYFILKYRMIHQKKIRLFSKREETPLAQTVYLLGNGSTGYTSYMEVLPKTLEQEVESGKLQKADYSVERMRGHARITLVKLFRSHGGGWIPNFELLESKSLYRPFWLIYYGNPRRDGRTLCAVRAADGYRVGKM